jgi:hypothetical protein
MATNTDVAKPDDHLSSMQDDVGLVDFIRIQLRPYLLRLCQEGRISPEVISEHLRLLAAEVQSSPKSYWSIFEHVTDPTHTLNFAG